MNGLLEALEIQAETAGRVAPGQLVLSTPCPAWSVRDVLNHSIGVTLKFGDFAAGVTDEPHTPAGDLVGTDHHAAAYQAVGPERAAWSGVDLSRSCRLPFGTFSAELAAGINLYDTVAHTWDIAVATDLALDCSDHLWNAALEAAREVIGAGRDDRHYGPEIWPSDGATVRDRFLGFVGRHATM